MPRLLLSGFEPFGGSTVNPSASVVEAIGIEGVPGADVQVVCLPVVGGVGAGSAFARLASVVESFMPDTIVSFGEAADATHLRFERVAINVRDDRIPDNAGVQLVDQLIVVDGAVAHFASLPLRTMRDACEGEGVPAMLSNSAGTFLCNELMYRTLDAMATRRWPTVTRAGFVHVPQLPEQVARRGGVSMRLDHQLLGLRASLLTLSAPLG